MRNRSLLLSSLVLGLASCQAPDSTTPEVHASESGSSNVETIHAVPASSPAASGQSGQEASERVQRAQERQTYLAGQYIQQGDEALERGDLRGAVGQYAQALQIMPSNEDAKSKMSSVRALLGDDFSQAADAIDSLAQREQVRRVQARLEVEQLSTKGDQQLAEGDYDAAVESFRRAETILRYHPLIADNSLDEQMMSQKLASAVKLAEGARLQRQAEVEAEARAARVARDEEQRTYRETKLRRLYSEANSAFHREQYGVSETLAEQILLYDPGNEHATELRDIAETARHQRATEDNARAYREQWIKTFDELNTMGVAQTESIEFDLRRWSKVRDRQPHAFSGEDPAGLADKKAIIAKLAETRIPSGRFEEGATLEEVANYLRDVSGVNFIISSGVRDDGAATELAVSLDLKRRSVLSILNLISETHGEDLDWTVEEGVVHFVLPSEKTGGQVLRMYEVGDLGRARKDFPGREINLAPSGGVPDVDEDFTERDSLVVAEDDLATLIEEHVAATSWQEDPNNTIEAENGVLVVNQTPEVQEQIAELLDELREATGLMVDIQARFLKVEDNFLEDIGVDFRGLGSPGKGTNAFFNDFGDSSAQQTLGNQIGTETSLGAFFDDGGDGDVRARTENLFDSFLGDEDVLTGSGGLQFQWTYLNDLQLEMILTAVSKSERVEIVTAPSILVFNGSRSNLSVMNQVAYVKDFDVEIAQSASIADPIISVVEDGVILDVRPQISSDRRFVTIELRPTVAELRRPMRTFTTSLGVSGNSVTIHLPELDISKVKTTIPMPDGATVLLGGMKIHEEEDLRSGIPILNKIPFLSFFFERQGTFITNRKLLVLVKAEIVIPTEHEPSAAQMGLDASLQPSPR